MIIAFSGKKQSGKGTCCEFLSHLLDVQVFAFADLLKKMCVDILGLRPEQVFGTDEQKNGLTTYRWEDLPHYTSLMGQWNKEILDIMAPHGLFWDKDSLKQKIWDEAAEKIIKKGKMTAREILQEVGTGIFRRMNEKVWVEATERAMAKSPRKFKLIGDMRFPGEAEMVKKNGGLHIRLTRDIYAGKDVHESETALDGHPCDILLDNANLTVEETLVVLVHELVNHDVINVESEKKFVDFITTFLKNPYLCQAIPGKVSYE